MNPVETIGEQIAFRYGLIPKSDWPTRIEKTLDLLSRNRSTSASEIGRCVLSDSNLIREVAGYLTVDETYFFRQQNHFDQLLLFLCDRIQESDTDSKISILSAGCAHGSEPYSLAIMLKERFDPTRIERIEIAACDLNLRAIEHARKGIFHQWSFRETNAMTKKLYFRKISGNRYQVRDDIRTMVSFHHLSIQERLTMTAACSLDTIFFRNVAVYMQADALAELYQTVTRVLKPGGLLLVSATDPQPSRPELRALVSKDTSIYRLRDDSSRFDSCPNGLHLVNKRTGFRSASHRPKVALRNESKRIGSKDAASQARLERVSEARMLADRGEYSLALALCHRLIDSQTECSEAHRLRGELRLFGLQPDEALHDFKHAVSLDPDDPICRYWYAVGLEAAGNYGTALGEVRQLIDRLASLPSGKLLSDGETAVAELLTAATALERNLE